MVDRIACSWGLTVTIGPANPASNRFFAVTAPTERGWLLAPIRAIDFGSKRASRLRVVMLREVRSAEAQSILKSWRLLDRGLSRAVSERTESVGGFPNQIISDSTFTPREGGGGDGSF